MSTTSSNQTPDVRLHRKAPWAERWDHRLRRTYRQWFAERGGRYFRLEADTLNDPWTVVEITKEGDFKDYVAVWVRNLPAARSAIADYVAGVDKDEISRRMGRAPGAPTGRSKRARRR